MSEIIIKEELTEIEREDLITKLHEDYLGYICDSDDVELQEIWHSGCFTVGSMNYYRIRGVSEDYESIRKDK